MAVRNLIPKIQLGTSFIEDTLKPMLMKMEQQGIESKGSWDQLHDRYLRMFYAQPDAETKSWPWRGASNLFLPLTRVTIEALIAQFFDAMLAQKPRVVGTEGSDVMAAEQLSNFYFDHVWTKILKLKEIGNDWLFDTLLDGTSAVKVRWSREKKIVRNQIIEDVTREETLSATILGERQKIPVITGIDQRIREEVLVVPEDRPAIDHTDLSRIYTAPGTGMSLQYPDCPWYFEEIFLTWDELQIRKRDAFWSLGDEEALESKLAEHDPGFTTRTKREQEEVSQDRELKTARVLVFYLRLVLPGTTEDIETGDSNKQATNAEQDNSIAEDVEIVYLADTKHIARLVPLSRINPEGVRPHIDSRYVRIPRSFYGQGIPQKLRHLNALINTSFNQMVDFGTLQNLPFFFYEPATTGLMQDINPMKPGQGIPVMSAGGITMPRFQGNNQQFQSIIQQVQAWSERDTSVTDFVQGRSPSVPNAPRTARGQNQMIAQSNIAFSRMVALMAEPFTEMLRRVHHLYQKNAPAELEFKFFNQETGLFRKQSISRDIFHEDVDFHFELNPNRVQEQQNNLLLAQFLFSIPFIAQIPQSVRALAKQLYVSFGKKNFDEIWPEQMLQVQAGQQSPPGAPPNTPQSQFGDNLGGLEVTPASVSPEEESAELG